MVDVRVRSGGHLDELTLADFLEGRLALPQKREAERHVAACDDCLAALVSGYESIGQFKDSHSTRKKRNWFMKKINLYLIGSVVAFTLSFFAHHHFLQLLIVTLILGIKWVSDSKSTRMLVMIHEAWKKGGEKEASRAMEGLEPLRRDRL